MKIKKFQMGGQMAPEAMPAEPGMEGGAPAGAEAGGDPIAQLGEAAMQALETQDPQIAFSVCEMILQLLQAGGPQGGAPAPAPEEPVMMRKGGKMCKKGGKMKGKKC